MDVDQPILLELRRLLAGLTRGRASSSALPRAYLLNPALSASEYIIAPAGFCETLTINWWRFYTLFVQTYEEFSDSGWTMMNGREKLIHVCVIRQLFLDWGVQALSVMKPIESKLNRHTWVSFKIFLKALGRVYRSKTSLPLNIASLHNKNLKKKIQQLLIFARIVLNGRKTLSREDICKVFVLAAPQAVPMEVIDSQQAETFRGLKFDSLTYEEFKTCLCFT